MKTILFIWGTGFLLFIIFVFLVDFVETKIDENHAIKKWWRKNVVVRLPEDLDL